MNESPKSATLVEFLTQLHEHRVVPGSVYSLKMPEFERNGVAALPIKVGHVPTADTSATKLIVQFHGAIDQTQRAVPFFQELLPTRLESQDTLSLSIADESLERSTEIKSGWYQGSARFDLCGAITELVSRVSAQLRSQRLVFVGSSVGAHAALVQSYRFENSCCVANNPIANIGHYFESHRNAFLRNCWPGVEKVEDIGGSFINDCGDLYRQGHPNQLIVVQNPTDHHFHRQAIHFVQQLPWKGNSLMVSEFDPEVIGHRFNGLTLRRWSLAALSADGGTCLDIARRFHELKNEAPVEENVRSSETTISKRNEPSERWNQDSAIASRLAAMAQQQG